MTANAANKKSRSGAKSSSRRSHGANTANSATVSRDATPAEIARVREQLIWFRDQGFTFDHMEHDLGKSDGWLHRVVNDSGRYRVTSIDVAVIRASYRSAGRLYRRAGSKYTTMRSIIQHAGAIMRDVEALAEEI
jgi:hypothetical protein